MGTCHSGQTESVTQIEGTQILWAHVCTQVDNPRSEAAVQTTDSGELCNLEVHLGPEGGEGCCGCRCVLLKELLEQMARLQREISSLRGSQESLRETHRRCESTPSAATQPHPKSLQVEVVNPAAHLQS